jgi:hypothetical protein
MVRLLKTCFSNFYEQVNPWNFFITKLFCNYSLCENSALHAANDEVPHLARQVRVTRKSRAFVLCSRDLVYHGRCAGQRSVNP